MAVVAVSVWRVRNEKRIAAKMKDKGTIARLQEENAQMRARLNATAELRKENFQMRAELKLWWDWYYLDQQHPQQQHRQSQRLDDDEIREEEAGDVLMALNSNGANPIDYSRWNHLQCSSDDASEYDEESEEEEEEPETGWEHENEGDEYAAQTEEEEEEDSVGLWCSNIGAELHVTINELSEDGMEGKDGQEEALDGLSKLEQNRNACIDMLRQTHAAIQQAFDYAKATAEQEMQTSALYDALEKEEKNAKRQFHTYIAMISDVPITEFEGSKARQLKNLIGCWGKELLANLYGIAEECRRDVSQSDSKTLFKPAHSG